MGHPLTPPPAYMRHMIPSMTIKGTSHKIYSMILTKKSKYYNMSNNLSSNNLSSCYYFTLKSIRILLGKISFITHPKLFISNILIFHGATSQLRSVICLSFKLIFQGEHSLYPLLSDTGLVLKYEE